jgi:hypothetical protein
MRRSILLAAAMAAGLMTAQTALAADISPDSLKLAAGVTKAPGYETGEATKFKAANTADILSGWQFYTSKTMGTVKAGDPVDTLGKVKGYDWYLVGKNGEGVGYLPRSLLEPAT